MSWKRITVFGQTNWDYVAKPGVKVALGEHLVELSRNGWRKRIPVDANASSGAKVNAANEISLRDLARFFYFPQPAGGAMNLAAAIQEITVNWPNRPVVRLIDTNEDNALVRGFCEALGIELVTLGRHACLRNYVLPFNDDKIIIRTGKIQLSDWVPDEIVEQVQAAARDSDIFALVSPKDALLASIAWRAAASARRYVNATGSLPWPLTSELTPDAHGLVFNFSEMRQYATAVGCHLPAVHEDSSKAANVAADALFNMKWRGYLSGGIAAVTRGRSGSVLVDLDELRAWKVTIRLRAGCPGVATRTGSGDRWLGSFILGRECQSNSQRDCHAPVIRAARFASSSVAQFLGLHRHEFTPEVEAIDVPDGCLVTSKCLGQSATSMGAIV